MEKGEITIELLYRKLENRLTEEEVKHFEMWMQDIDHQRYYRNLQSFYELREDGRPDSAQASATLNNRGVLKLLQGDLDSAESYFKQAQAKGSVEAGANLEEMVNKRKDDAIFGK